MPVLPPPQPPAPPPQQRPGPLAKACHGQGRLKAWQGPTHLQLPHFLLSLTLRVVLLVLQVLVVLREVVQPQQLVLEVSVTLPVLQPLLTQLR